ncbi:hypothetical protein [Gordonia alkanivorans]|uniref:hypothetical protein n=1 Tax=Gordonia alkanivorans TaxID=84096 RepID=UPI00244AF0AB|nr:hypothetical protein [Gordonia alkanivorans]MDH3045047.1 hypothetical protein [Gordonia alkanivorans]
MAAIWRDGDPRPKAATQSLRNLVGELKADRQIEVLDVGKERFLRLRVSPKSAPTKPPIAEDYDDLDGIEFDDE